MITDQEVFNKVKSHLLEQREVASSIMGECKYRINGLKCAIGCLIPNNLYDPDMETHLVRGLLELWPWLGAHLGNNIKLLESLQNVHDANEPKDWEGLLDDFRPGSF